MSRDLTALAASAALCLALVLPCVAAQVVTWGPAVTLGNRGAVPRLPAWTERAVRAHRNLLENLPHFAVFVLVAHVSGAANPTTAAGAALFFWSRVAHAALYIAGVPVLRTLAFASGVTGELLVALQLLGGR
jgi:uncharacterized MAPEG superfamily protein